MNGTDHETALVAQMAATLASGRKAQGESLDADAIAREAWALLEAVNKAKPEAPKSAITGFARG